MVCISLLLFGCVKFTLKLVDFEPQRMKKKRREKSSKICGTFMVIAKVTFSKVDEIFSEGKQEPEPMARSCMREE